MPRWSEWVTLDDGTKAIVCYSGPRPRAAKPCQCGATSTKLCDYPVRLGRTCDAPLCAACAVSVGRNRDWCPQHKEAA